MNIQPYPSNIAADTTITKAVDGDRVACVGASPFFWLFNLERFPFPFFFSPQIFLLCIPKHQKFACDGNLTLFRNDFSDQ